MKTREEFMARLRPQKSGCVLFDGPTDPQGRVSVKWSGRTRRAHQVAFDLANGMVPPLGLVVMHTCDVPACCNPAHLVLGTQDENMADMAAKGRAWSPGPHKTQCKHGHLFSRENTYVRKGRLGRQCMTCVREAKARYRARLLAAGMKPFPNRSHAPESETAPVAAGAVSSTSTTTYESHP